ncbi:MAG: type I-E CRISPR-associated protein Cas7/Cse4/CasC [Oscillospiraceae bacterium]|nr:type I-E CRISPR-associated protein Cas7/Cse4/CasC [Oscillospiraceae bacterium]
MKKKRLYIDFHVIQTVPPSCVNRDDTGRPKTAVYGGVNRARVSSQSWKHAIRNMFTDIFSDEQLGFRTMHATDLIAKHLIQNGIEKGKADKMAVEALSNAGISTKTDKKKENATTKALFFISRVQIKKLAELVIAGVKDKKEYKKVLQNYQSIDIALFGRMVADDVDLNVDASSQVAHSISTHAVQSEYDYFTAVDDYSTADNAGAGHLGTTEFNSATLYRYATVNVAELFQTIGTDTADAVKGFAEAFICSMPTGKQNSYANRTLPDLVYVTIRTNQPVNLSGAFEKPVRSKEGYTEESVKKLFAHAQKVYDNYCETPVHSFVIGSDSVLGAEKVNLPVLLEQLHDYISDFDEVV